MLTDYFRDPKAVERLRSGVLGRFIDSFVTQLEALGLAVRTVQNYLGSLSYFAGWGGKRGLTLASFDRKALDALERHGCSRRCPARRLAASNRLTDRVRTSLQHARAHTAAIPLEAAALIYDPEDRPRIAQLMRHASKTGERIIFEARITRYDGARAWIRVFGEGLYEGGECVGLRGACMDISEEKSAEEALRRAAVRRPVAPATGRARGRDLLRRHGR